VRKAIAAVAAGLAILLGAGSSAVAQYAPSSTTTSTSTTTSLPSHPQGAEASFTLAVSSSTVAPGQTISVAAPDGLCAPGSTVSIDLVEITPGATPVQLATATANTSGGFPPTNVTIPTGASSSLYVVFALCTTSNGSVQVITGALVVTGGGGGGGGLAAQTAGRTREASWSAPATWGTPTQRAALDQAVTATLAAEASSTPGAASAALHGVLAAAHRPEAGTSWPGTAWAVLAALALLASAAALAALRRRHASS
jgi:hypothetical protein